MCFLSYWNELNMILYHINYPFVATNPKYHILPVFGNGLMQLQSIDL